MSDSQSAGLHWMSLNLLAAVNTVMFPVPSGLQTDEGLQLMEILARMAKIQMTDFAELS